MSVLQAIDLKKYYGTEPNITRALDGVNFSVEDGEFVAVVGTSGSGKSTLLHMMGGLDTPTSGTVIVRGEELAKKNDEQLTIFRRRNIGFIFQNYNLVPILNVYENIVLPVELDGDTVDQKFLDEIVHLLGLEDKLKNMPNNLSGGQQQRVAIARGSRARHRPHHDHGRRAHRRPRFQERSPAAREPGGPQPPPARHGAHGYARQFCRQLHEPCTVYSRRQDLHRAAPRRHRPPRVLRPHYGGRCHDGR